MKKLNGLMLVLMLVMTTAVFAQGRGKFPDAIVNATRSNDSRSLAAFFNEKVELVLPDKSGVYSKSQAEQVIKSFFATNPADEFSIIHQGERDNSSFAIGKYKTKGKSLRFYFLVKDNAGTVLIHQLRIENQDE